MLWRDEAQRLGSQQGEGAWPFLKEGTQGRFAGYIKAVETAGWALHQDVVEQSWCKSGASLSCACREPFQVKW